MISKATFIMTKSKFIQMTVKFWRKWSLTFWCMMSYETMNIECNCIYWKGLKSFSVYSINCHGLLTGCSLPYCWWPSACFTCSNVAGWEESEWHGDPFYISSIRDAMLSWQTPSMDCSRKCKCEMSAMSTDIPTSPWLKLLSVLLSL